MSWIMDVKVQLTRLLNFFEPLKCLANSHCSAMFTENLWEKNVPQKIQEELSTFESQEDFIKMFSEFLKTGCSTEYFHNRPNLMTFLNNVENFSLGHDKNYISSVTTLEKLLLKSRNHQGKDFTLEQFMTLKKLHEVRITSKIAAMVSDMMDSSHIVDIGVGKGYLSYIMVLHHSCKVLGLDASQVKTCGAIKRSEKVAQIWRDGVFTEGNVDFQCVNKKTKKEYLNEHYKVAITYVTPDTNLREMVEEKFSEQVRGITLTGLHTCGNLAPTCLKLFINDPSVNSLVNIGCCYHLLSEEFCERNESQDFGFPMSKFLKSQNYSLGRNARMLASHSLDRMSTITNLDEDYSTVSMFYRSIVETFLKTRKEPLNCEIKLKKLAKKCPSFHEYFVKVVKKFNLDIEVTEEYSSELYRKFEDRKPIFMAYNLLRVSLSPVVEAIVLLDRFLYLLENGIDNVYLVKLFNLEISPRGFGIVAWRDVNKKVPMSTG